MLNDCKQVAAYKQVIFQFAFFHAIVQERRKFGPIGWNIPYDFTNEDINTCAKQVRHFLDKYDYVPYKVFNYLGAKINYGGRVTDTQDKILIQQILVSYLRPELSEQGQDFKFTESGLFYCPNQDTQQEFLDYIDGL